MVVSFKTSQPPGEWIKTTMKHSDRQKPMEALRRHFDGEGNVTWNLAEAERLNE